MADERLKAMYQYQMVGENHVEIISQNSIGLRYQRDYEQKGQALCRHGYNEIHRPYA